MQKFDLGGRKYVFDGIGYDENFENDDYGE